MKYALILTLACQPALAQSFDDLKVTWAKDGACYVMQISNHLAYAPTEASYTIVDPVPVYLTVLHAVPKGPETIFASVPVGWTVWPEQIEIADHDEGSITICPEVGV